MQLDQLSTEQSNAYSTHLDVLSIEEAAALMNREDTLIAPLVGRALPAITQAIRSVVAALDQGGRLIYIGAGNSGRTGYQDALECQPTFNTPPEQVLGLIAGGFAGFSEAAEDHPDQGAADLQHIALTDKDVVIGLSASGRTPYVIGALNYAADIGSRTVALVCNTQSEISKLAQVVIEVDCGPEILAGSTRLKAGTAQKMICNMISTLSMVALGKTYRNLMVDVQVNNQKLADRARRIVAEAAGVSREVAADYLARAGQRPRIAILMLLAGLEREQAEALEAQSRGSIHRALQLSSQHQQN